MHLLTPVWGGHVQLYADVVLPALMAPGNIPAIGDYKYTIFTTPEGRAVIEASPAFPLLTSVDIQPLIEHENPHVRCTEAYRRGIQWANYEDAPCVFLCPDLVFADGSLAAMKRIAENHDVVWTTGIRTKKAEVAAALECLRIGYSITVQPRDLMRFALDNLHPLAHNSFWKGYGPDFIPANLYWAAGDDGIVARCFHLHPLFVRPQAKDIKFPGTIDEHYAEAACPDTSRDYVVTDSDELLMIELSPPEHYFRMKGYRKGHVGDAARWAKKKASKRHRLLFNSTIRMHTGVNDGPTWQRALDRATQIASNIKHELKHYA